MDIKDLTPQVDDLEANIDELEDALEPLLRSPLLTTASSLPLLDKAKLYVLYSYAVESILFSTLQASGANAKEHPVFAELARLKGYFGKIKNAESGPEPKTRIDKDAAARFIKHGLAGNDVYDAQRAERIAREKARAELKKARGKHTKFDQAVEEQKMEKMPKKRPAEETEFDGKENEEVNESMYDGDGINAAYDDSAAAPPKKKLHTSASELNDNETSTPSTPATPASTSKSSTKKSKEERHPELSEERQARRAERREAKQKKKIAKESKQELIVPTREAPRTHSETFKALLEGPLKKKEKKAKGK